MADKDRTFQVGTNQLILEYYLCICKAGEAFYVLLKCHVGLLLNDHKDLHGHRPPKFYPFFFAWAAMKASQLIPKPIILTKIKKK